MGNSKERPMIPTTYTAKRISTLFRRRLDTSWSEKEVKQYRRLAKDNLMTPENLELLERYYVYQRKKENGIHRRDLYTFLNNFAGELDRAQAWDEEQRERLKRKVRRPLDADDGLKPVDDSEFQRLGDLARKELERFKAQYA